MGISEGGGRNAKLSNAPSFGHEGFVIMEKMWGVSDYSFEGS